MLWSDTPCFTTCWNDGNCFHEAMRRPKIEFILIQHPWMENDCLFADIILPVNTKFEEDDIGADMIGCQYNSIYLEEKCIEPRGETKSDYEIVCAIADKLGLLKEYTEGKSVQQWIQTGFDTFGVPEAGLCTWEKLKENKYYVIPTDPDWKKFPAGCMSSIRNPEKYPYLPPAVSWSIYSARLAKHFPTDDERPPVPHWVEKSENHDERISGERAKEYPLLVVSNHPRWRVHAQWMISTGSMKFPPVRL